METNLFVMVVEIDFEPSQVVGVFTADKAESARAEYLASREGQALENIGTVELYPFVVNEAKS